MTGRRLAVPLLAALAATSLLLWWRPATVFTVLGAALLYGRFAAAAGPAPLRRPSTASRVVAVVPVYNETPEALWATLASLAGQTRPPDRVLVVDDGSDRYTYEDRPGWVDWLALDRNVGKRLALAAGMKASPDADVWLFTDSDTVLDRHCVERLAGTIGHGVVAATGLICASNRTANWLTRVQDVQYTTAFAVGRGAQSALGAVLVCSGALACYDAHAIRPYVDLFSNERFRGRLLVASDDRRLTGLALRHGRAVYVPDAWAWTEVPERVRVWARQQIRWGRPWLRESFRALAELPLRNAGWWVTLADVAVWTFFAAAFAASIGFAAPGGLPSLAAGYAACALILGPVRAVRYVTDRHDLSMRARLGGLALAPLYSVLYMVVGIPIRLWAILTMGNQGWGTRSAADAPAPTGSVAKPAGG